MPSSLSRDSHHVTVWASTAPTPEFEQLFEPNAAAYESDDLPIDAFAAAIGTRYYDQDLLERTSEDSVSTVGALLSQFSQGSHLERELADSLRNLPARNLVLLYGYRTEPTAEHDALRFVATLRLSAPVRM